jgi:perosamine synthetase
MQDQLLRALKSAPLMDKLATIHLVGSGEVTQLEIKLADHYGMKHALCVSNATTGLMALGLALELRDKEFVTTPFTYGASVAGFLLLGSKPVFADIEKQTLTLSPQSVEERITPKTKMILAVDVFGNPSDCEALRRIADEHGLWLIADCSQSLGARRDGHPSNYLADALVVSFTVGKPLFGGEGGAVVTDNTELFEKLVWMTQHPYRQQKELGLANFNEFALNARIHPVAAIWANSTFESSMELLEGRRASFFKLIETLKSIELTTKIDFARKGIEPTFFRFSAEWQKNPSPDLLEHELSERGLCFSVGENPVELLYRQNAFVAQYPSLARATNPCPEAERQAKRRFCLLG